MKYSLTPGADRTIQRAIELAAGNDVQPLHVLKAILLEEVVAARALDAFGVNLLVVGELGATRCQDEARKPDYVEAVLQAASSAFHSDPEQSEIQSEHILYGLLTVPSGLVLLLGELGLTTDSAREFFAEPPKEDSPIEVDFSFDANVASEPITNPVKSSPTNDAIQGLAAIGPTATSSADDNVFRIVDAASNRLREGLRVLDDYVRFILNEPELTSRVKLLRHRVAESARHLNQQQLLSARNTPGDVGTSIHTSTEMARHSLEDVVIANLKRIQESARSLEEFGKLIDVDFAGQMKQLRYEFYTLESLLVTKSANAHSSPPRSVQTSSLTESSSVRKSIGDCHLYVLITEAGCTADWKTTVSNAIAGGVDVLQLREKHLADDELIVRAKWLRSATAGTDTLFIMNDRPDIAAIVGADGVHIGQSEGTVAAARETVGLDRLIGVSTHSIEQARQAVLDGADYIGVGPVFPSTTKNFEKFPGLDFVTQVANKISIPAFSIGGITSDNLDSVIKAGCNRVAITAAVCAAGDVATATRKLKTRLTVVDSE